MITITAVSYTNTLPFIYGIEKSGILQSYQLKLKPPSACTSDAINKKSDIVLIPAGGLSLVSDYQIFSDFCIGAYGNVGTVALFAQKPVEKIDTIHLDNESHTSVKLLKILSKHYWQRKFVWKSLDTKNLHNSPLPEAMLAIGDKTFSLTKKYAYQYDLSDVWKRLTGKPFVFACWVASKNVSMETIQKFNNCLSYGVARIDEAVRQYKSQNHDFYMRYLEEKINFTFKKEQNEALDYFLKLEMSL